MKVRLFTTPCLCALAISASSQVYFGLAWQVSLGGSNAEIGRSICPTTGGYWLLGETYSNNAQVSGNHGVIDFWLARINDLGSLTWQRAYGGTNSDRSYALCGTNDGGCVMVGGSVSNDGDVSGNHGGYDVWAVRVNSVGELIWQRSLGGAMEDCGRAVIETPDGGFLVTGYARSNDGDVIGHVGATTGADFWTLRFDTDGVLIWQSTLGGTLNDMAYGLCLADDGGSFIVGEAFSSLPGAHGMRDAWVCRLDPDGELLWSTLLGGSLNDMAYDVIATPDGGAMVVGETESNDGDVVGSHGGTDGWVVRLSSTGGVLWQRPLGGSDNDSFSSIIQAGNGRYLLGGTTESVNGNVSGIHGLQDTWLALIDSEGTLLWQNCYGGSATDLGAHLTASPWGGAVLVGSSGSTDGDATNNHGLMDMWAVRLDDFSGIAAYEESLLLVHPNPATNLLWVSLGTRETTRVMIQDINGRVAGSYLVRGPEASIDLSGIAPGAYSIIATDAGLRSANRLLIVK